MTRRNQRTERGAMLGALLAATLLAGPALAGGGNVFVSGQGNRVNVNGDINNSDNDFSVTQVGNNLIIEGRNGTTVSAGQGASVDPNDPNKIIVPGVGAQTEVKVRAKGGNNTIEVDDLNVNRIDIKTIQNGNNTIDVDDSRAGDKLDIETGGGNDSISVSNTAWGRRDVDAGGGTNTVTPGVGGKGRQPGQVGTPPAPPNPNPTPTPGGNKGAGNAPLQGQADGLPTKNPGMRGMVNPGLKGGKHPSPKAPKGSGTGSSPGHHWSP